MNEKKTPLAATLPAAKELRKVPGFDPLKLLRSTVSRNGEKVLKLDLRYKRLWFRLACPNGRMVLNPLRITDQMAIIEARLYASKDDAAPLASFTATQMAKNVPGVQYVRAAQDEALNEVLDNAGFGIQLCDVAQVSDGSGFGSEIPLSQIEKARQDASSAAAPVEEPLGKKPSAEKTGEQASVPAEPPVSASTETAAPVTAEPSDALPQEQSDAAEPSAEDIQAELVESTEESPSAGDKPLSYSEDMSVEEICAHMTLEEARNIVVPLGTCKGWTLGQVYDSRRGSLKWYLVGCQNASNLLKAGASLLLKASQEPKDAALMQKAG